MSIEILDCVKRQRDFCVKNVVPSQNTAFMFTPALEEIFLNFENCAVKKTIIIFCRWSNLVGITCVFTPGNDFDDRFHHYDL